MLKKINQFQFIILNKIKVALIILTSQNKFFFIFLIYILGSEKLKIIKQIKLNKLNYIIVYFNYQLFEIKIFLFVVAEIAIVNKIKL